jgi:RNA polymerase sigma factor (sigma-70 family)
MTGGTSGSKWPGTDERSTVEEMLRDRNSQFWEECYKFVKRRVYSKAKNIPIDHHGEIVQEIMYKVARYLPAFHFQCSLKTWLNLIIESCIIDLHRRLHNESEVYIPLVERDPSNESEHDNEGISLSENRSTEDIALVNEKIRDGLAALFEYTTLHSNPIRDRLIIDMVISGGYTHEQVARAVGCKAPVVGYVVREARRYAREKMRNDS